MRILVINDYEHSIKVIKEFRMENVGDYHDLY